MEQPKHLQTVIDRQGPQSVELEAPVLHGSYRTIYRVFLGVTLIQIAYLLAAHSHEARSLLEQAGLNLFAPIYPRLALFSFDNEANLHLHALLTAAAVWSISAIQEKEYGIARWFTVLAGTLIINFGLLIWLDAGEHMFVIYWAALAFVLGQALSAKLAGLLTQLKKGVQVGELLPAGLILFVFWYVLAAYPFYLPTALAGAALGVSIAMKRSGMSL